MWSFCSFCFVFFLSYYLFTSEIRYSKAYEKKDKFVEIGELQKLDEWIGKFSTELLGAYEFHIKINHVNFFAHKLLDKWLHHDHDLDSVILVKADPLNLIFKKLDTCFFV
ncbi:unnamed protein product [Cuscuta europaea]|uniref:Uncharacterized protein n=1 Tax=Cuscuta europaea TaxID=41803 RepID=A0A9P0YJ34_CUSEU|nr:unnamed protein product [Cuscuta europaea]